MSKLYTNAFTGWLTLTPVVSVRPELNPCLSYINTSLEFKLDPIDLSLFKEFPPRENRVPFINTLFIELCFIFHVDCLSSNQRNIWQDRYLRDSSIHFKGFYNNIARYLPDKNEILKFKTEINFENQAFEIRHFKKEYCLTTTIPSKDVKELLIPECKRMSEE